jgi:hypothetical protein
MHLRIAFPVGILLVELGASMIVASTMLQRLNRQALASEIGIDPGEKLRRQIIGFQQVPKIEEPANCRIEATSYRCLFHRRIRQSEPVLHQMNP